MQEDQQEALNEEVDATTVTESPTEEQTTDVQTDVSIETPVAPKKGAQSRIRELSGEVRSLKDRVAELTSPVGLNAPQVPYQPQSDQSYVDTDGSIDVQEFKRQVLNEANQIIDFRTQQNAVVQQINRQADEMVTKYSELNPESDSFDEELNNDVYEIVEAKLKADPTSDVRKLVAKQVALFRRAASKEEAKTEAVIAKQAAQSAIRPSQSKPVDTKFVDLTVEEMRNKLGYAE